ncbi:efflux pump protein [Karstenula rhodostoma CBS 690.94]|uniref:Efflux pump protein n=1 Tax=Karstenula rhodostoma CBS 690.94 TaxID=1392251 RepID=A0A9P4UIG5_9PLEO|nr:efflux pump protein [Karstenula rhodostoma CBS 690.94]
MSTQAKPATASATIATPEPTSLPTSLPIENALVPKKSKTESEKAEMHYVTGFRLFMVVASVSLITFLLLLDQSILSTAIPHITSQFHSLPDVGWYSGAYQLAAAALQPLSGKIYTYMKIKHVFLAHLFVFELGSLICAIADSSSMLIGGRALAGLGASGLMNGGLNILTNSTPLEKRPLYTGIMIGIGQMGLVSGPLIGGALTEHVTWRWCFYMNLPIGAVTATMLALIHIPEPNPKAPYSSALFKDLVLHKLDLPGFALFAPACIMLLLALQFGGEGSHAWDSATIIGLFVGAGVVTVIFIAWEERVGEKAMIPGSLFKSKILLACIGQTIGLGVCVFVGSLWVPTYFQSVKGAGPTESGVNVLPQILSQLLFAVVSGAAVSKLGFYMPWAVFSGAAVAIGNGLMSTLTQHTSTAKWIGYMIILGAGRGAGIQMAFVATQSALPMRLIPVSLALIIFVQNLAGAIFLVVANTIFTQSLIKKLGQYAPSVSPQAALEAGSSADAVRKLVDPSKPWEVDGVLNAYSESLKNIWLMLVAFAGLAFICAFGMGWVDVRKKNADKEEKEREEESAVSEKEGV